MSTIPYRPAVVKRISIIRHSKLSNNSTSALPMRFPLKENQFRLLVEVDFSASGKHYISAGRSFHWSNTLTLSVSSLLQFSFGPFFFTSRCSSNLEKTATWPKWFPTLSAWVVSDVLETLRIEAKCSAIQGSAGNGILAQKSIPYPGRC